jgi:hypothetical protein
VIIEGIVAQTCYLIMGEKMAKSRAKKPIGTKKQRQKKRKQIGTQLMRSMYSRVCAKQVCLNEHQPNAAASRGQASSHQAVHSQLQKGELSSLFSIIIRFAEKRIGATSRMACGRLEYRGEASFLLWKFVRRKCIACQ